eukprot:759734_1
MLMFIIECGLYLLRSIEVSTLVPVFFFDLVSLHCLIFLLMAVSILKHAWIIVLLILLPSIDSFTSFTSPMDRFYPHTLSELLSQSKDTDEAIYGNPLLYPQCANALLNEHEHNLDNLLKKSGIPTPWFWSRETLDATIKHEALHRRLKVTSKYPPEVTLPWSTHAAYEYGRYHAYLPHHMVKFYHRLGDLTENEHKNMSVHTEHISNEHKLKLMNDKSYIASLPADAHYYHIEKSGSSSLGGTLIQFGGFNRTYLSENTVTHVDCGFTFVREPISRFISGYYTVNMLIYMHNKYAKKRYPIPDKFSFWNITGEPQRVREFIKNLIEFRYEFLVSSPLEHIMSQTSVLSVAQTDIHFVGRLHKFKDHLDRMLDHCGNRFLTEPIDKIMSRMSGFGQSSVKDEPDYARMMGLRRHKKGMVLPAYKAIADSYESYQSLVEFFRQDFICFGFDHDYKAFRDNVYKKMAAQYKNNAKHTKKQ